MEEILGESDLFDLDEGQSKGIVSDDTKLEAWVAYECALASVEAVGQPIPWKRRISEIVYIAVELDSIFRHDHREKHKFLGFPRHRLRQGDLRA